MMTTSELSSNATRPEASIRGVTSRCTGLMPSTSMASISSRMVRDPRSAHIAVAPAPATISTVTSGPTCVTAPNAAPAPDRSAAPSSRKQDVEGETHQHGERDGHQQGGRQRHPGDEPGLLQELPPLEGTLEDEPDGVGGHREQAADGLHRGTDAFAQGDARRPAIRLVRHSLFSSTKKNADRCRQLTRIYGINTAGVHRIPGVARTMDPTASPPPERDPGPPRNRGRNESP